MYVWEIERERNFALGVSGIVIGPDSRSRAQSARFLARDYTMLSQESAGSNKFVDVTIYIRVDLQVMRFE